jgi:hypothetical protein
MLDPDPHQSVNSWSRISFRISLQMAVHNVLKITLFEHFFKVLSLYLEAWIRIRVKGER